MVGGSTTNQMGIYQRLMGIQLAHGKMTRVEAAHSCEWVVSELKKQLWMEISTINPRFTLVIDQ